MSKGNNINVDSIEEDIKILKNIIEVYENCSVPEIDMQVDITLGKKEINAIKTVLGNLEALCDMQMAADRELKNARKINEEHRKINGELREKVKELEVLQDDIKDKRIVYIDEPEFEANYIPKQKIKDEMKKYEWAMSDYDSSIADYKQSQAIGRWAALQELLQESEDK